MNYPKILIDLIDCYKKLPGVGSKSAERMALATLDLNDDVLNKFSNSISNLKNSIKRCSICNNYCEEDICNICANNSRDKKTVCVIEEPKNINMFENIGTYNGVYHVLGGLISPLDGISPEQLNIISLLDRIKNDSIEEIIFALKPSLEGETTARYIKKLINNDNIKITKIAHGVPLGADIDYIDSLTLELALEDRKDV